MGFVSLVVAAYKGTIQELNGALFSSAKTAVNIAIGLIGAMALWLGIMKVAEVGGLMKLIARALSPLMKRLFPEIPPEHPAMSAIIMNMAANMLGLGNAATPMGIKAMQEMQKLNPTKDTATNSMALFLAINTSSVTLLPLGVITIRAAAGNNNPSSILVPSLVATLCSTAMAITMAKLLQKRNPLPPLVVSPSQESALNEETVESGEKIPPSKRQKLFITTLLIAFGIGILFTSFHAMGGYLSDKLFMLVEGKANLASPLSMALTASKDLLFAATTWLLPVIILALLGFGFFKGVKVYETVTEGAKDGFNTAVRIIPFMVAIIVAIGMVRASGTLDLLAYLLTPVTNLIGMPIEAISLAVMRPLSGGGSFGMMSEIINNSPNGFLSDLVSTMQGSTETTFYVLAVYFGAVGIKKSRHALPAALMADLTGFIAAFLVVKLFLY